ncbi:ArnT family glycosyltransferase [Sandaracinus amylolyticus]|uniref:ArnT family glycosyltransferase n=1 Tax=Sandaracinus amylolyticus TaxID=927083 RepID=UPI001F1860EA|nr:glycosyltransferase family 39 protein [Sandaracinus amylolyticus]
MRAPRTSSNADRASLLALIAATLVGGALRLSTVTWGDPFLFHPDERGFVMWEAASIEWRGMTRGEWRPDTTTYGPVIYELALALKWAFLGGFDEAREEAQRYPDSWAYVVAGMDAWDDGEPYSFLRWTQLVRVFGAIGSAIAIALMGLAAWKLAGPRAGVITAWLSALCAGLVQASHYATTDSLVLVWAAMLLHACARLARVGRSGSALYAGISLGLIAATKMTGLVLLAVVPVAIAASTGNEGLLRSDRFLARHWVGRSIAALATKRFAIVVVVTIAIYALLCPWAFFDRDAYFAVPANRSGRHVFLSQYTDSDYEFWDWRFTYNGTTPFLYLLTHVIPYAVGIPVMIAGIVGMARWWRRDGEGARIALLAALPTFLLVGPWGVKTIRYAIPVVPGLLLGAGLWCARAWDRGAWRRALVALVIAAGLARGIAFTAMFWEPDPRALAGRWLLDHAERGDIVVLGPEASYSAPLGGNEDGVGVDRPPMPGLRVRRMWQSRPADVPAHVDSLLRDARFVVVDEFYLRRGTHPEARWRARDQSRFYRALFDGDTGFELVATFAREPRLGPIVWDESDAEMLAVAFDHMPVYVFERRGEYRTPFPR